MDTEKESWEGFRYRFIETGWFDYDRIKTAAAMQKLWERVPQDDIDKLPGPLIVFAPSADKLGEVFPFSPQLPGREEEGAFVYLSPLLEKKSQAVVDSTVAHEFAHVVLGCYRPDYTRERHPPDVHFETQGDVPSEQDADALISRWGFKPAYEGNRKKHRRKRHGS